MLAATAGVQVPDIGPLDTNDVTPIRLDRYLRDGDGSFYWWMTTLLPGFRQFRFPGKLLTFSTLGLAALAGMGWDDSTTRRRRGTVGPGRRPPRRDPRPAGRRARSARAPHRAVQAAGPRARRSARSTRRPATASSSAAWSTPRSMLAIALALISAGPQAADASPASLVILVVSRSTWRWPTSRYVSTVPQSLMETKPEVVRIIEEAERKDPVARPFRVHRMPLWNPPSWLGKQSDDRVRDFVAWERETIQPKYGINQGVEYTHTIGVAELYDYEWFFGGFPYKVRGETARSLGVDSGHEGRLLPAPLVRHVEHPLLHPAPSIPTAGTTSTAGSPRSCTRPSRSIPPPSASTAPSGKARRSGRGSRRRTSRSAATACSSPAPGSSTTPAACPRSTACAGPSGPARCRRSSTPTTRSGTTPTQTAYDPRRLVWIDNDDRLALRPYLTGAAPALERDGQGLVSESPAGRARREARHARASSSSPTSIIPAGSSRSTASPPRSIRANRMMRGAAVEAGTHRLVYTYRPRLVPHRRQDHPGRTRRLGPVRRLLCVPHAAPTARTSVAGRLKFIRMC